MTSDHVFGSDELTPDMVRGASFAEHDGRIDANEVRTFLDRVASSLEVFMSADAPTALRAEFARNAEIAQQVLDAGQNASEQLRRQAAEDAKRILDEARDATLSLRSSVDQEIEQARVQVESMRGGFTQELRDLYDRIGASLYRFERAAAESQFAPIQEPLRPTAPAPVPDLSPEPAAPAPPAPTPTPAPALAPAAAAEPAAESFDPAAPGLPEGAKPPAWQQLPAEAYSTPEPAPAPEAASTSSSEPVRAIEPETSPFEPVVEDEPLAPGEPLVDLRQFADAVDAAPATADSPAGEEPAADGGASWLDDGANAGDELPPFAPQAAGVATGPGASPDESGSWLDTPLDPTAGSPPADPGLSHDDALAEALIASGPLDDLAPAAAPAGPSAPADAPTDAPTAPPAATPPVSASASADALAIRQLILDSLAAGQTRETVETYLRDQLGMLEPGAIIDAALTSTPGA